MANTLIIAPNWIGDAVMSEPLLRFCHEAGHQLTVLASPWVAPVYRAMPCNPKVIEGAFSHGKIEYFARKKLAQQIASFDFEQALLLPNSWKSVIIPLLAKIPKVYGYRGELRSLFLKQYLENPPKKNRPPMVRHYLNLGNLINLKISEAKQEIYPKLQVTAVTPENISTVDFLKPGNNLYILAPGAEYGPAKQWPLSHFAELAKSILEKESSSSIVLMGSPRDFSACEEILQIIDAQFRNRIQNLCRTTNLDQSIAIIARAKGLASNDSGLMHIAAAFSIPQIAFFGSSDPKHTPPLSPFAGILFLGLDCSPCHQRKCPLGHLNCLTQILPQKAFDALERCVNLRKSI
jgi:heptosyltransferase II